MAKNEKATVNECSIEGCESPVAAAELCSACYSGLHYWLKKTPGQVIKRRKQLHKLQNRMEFVTSNRRPTKE